MAGGADSLAAGTNGGLCRESSGRTKSPCKIKNFAESGSSNDGTRYIQGQVTSPLDRTPGRLIPALTVGRRTTCPTKDALRASPLDPAHAKQSI